MWGEDRRPLPALLHGALLAHSLPQVLLLPGPAGGHWHHLLQQRGHDSVSERLHQTVWAQRGVQRLRPVDPSQRNGDEGAGKCLPPQVFQLCHLQKQTDPWRSLPLHQRYDLLRARPTRRRPTQQSHASTSEQPRDDRPEGMLSGSSASRRPRLSSRASLWCTFLLPATIVVVVASRHCPRLPSQQRKLFLSKIPVCHRYQRQSHIYVVCNVKVVCASSKSSSVCGLHWD